MTSPSVPVQRTNILAILASNLPAEYEAVLDKLASLRAASLEHEEYLTTLEGIAKAAGIQLHLAEATLPPDINFEPWKDPSSLLAFTPQLSPER